MPSEYDEEPFDETEPQLPASTEVPVIDLKISNYDLGRMMDLSIRSAMERHVAVAVEKFVEKKVSKAIDALVKQISTSTIEAHVKEALTKGWTKVNQWGEPVAGSTITLDQVVRDGLLAMSAPKSDGYNKPAISPITGIVQEMAVAGIKEGLAPILAEAKEQLKTQLDLSIGKSLRLTLGELAKG